MRTAAWRIHAAASENANPRRPVRLRGRRQVHRAIARRYGISDCAIRKRAAAEGWDRTQREAGPRLLTDRDVEGMFLTEQDIEAMILTDDDLARLFGGR